jgi:heptosyltransferase-2
MMKYPGVLHNILVCRRHNHIGDMLCSLPLYAAIRKRWPAARITLLANPTRYPIPLRDLNPFLDEVIYYQKSSIGTVVGGHLDIRRRNFDAVFVPSTVALSRTSHLTAFLSGARLRCGVRSIDGVRNPSENFLNLKSDVHWITRKVHQLERNREVAEIAGCTLTDDEVAALRMPISPSAETEAARRLSSIPAGKPIVGIHSGAGKEQNVWETGRFFEVLRRLHQERQCTIILTGGAVDKAELSVLGGMCTAHAIPFVFLVDAHVQVLSAAMRRFSLYLCNDTGTMHISAFSGCPTVSLFGPTNAWEWAPEGTMHRCVISPDGEMQSIGIEEVYGACLEILQACTSR